MFYDNIAEVTNGSKVLQPLFNLCLIYLFIQLVLNLFNFAVIVSRTTVFQLSFLIILVWLVSTFKWTLKSDRKDQILTILSLPYSPFFNFFCCLNLVAGVRDFFFFFFFLMGNT